MLYLYYRTTFVPVRKYISLPLEINKHYMAIKRFGVSLEENQLESLDKYVDENGLRQSFASDPVPDRKERGRKEMAV